MNTYYNYIVIEGNIGAGKTTLACRIADQFNARLILEQFENNPFLSKFYREPDRYSLPLELSFLVERYRQLIEEPGRKNHPDLLTVSDYYFSKSLIFASATLSGDEFTLYRQLYDIIFPYLPQPDIYVYLHMSPEKLLGNIKRRGREFEQAITIEYLQRIQESYFESFKEHTGFTYLVLNLDNIDFVKNTKDYKKVMEAVFDGSYKPGLSTLIL